MKQTMLLFFLLILTSTGSSFGQEIAEKQVKFANSFIQSVSDHNSKSILKHLEKNYKKEQLEFLGGRTEQFINELFGGVDISSDDYINIKYKNIIRIEIAEVIEEQDGYTYVFRIRDGKHDVLSSLFLVKKGKKYGFIGAVG